MCVGLSERSGVTVTVSSEVGVKVGSPVADWVKVTVGEFSEEGVGVEVADGSEVADWV